MIDSILIARSRKTGKDVVLADRAVPFSVQRAEYKKFKTCVSDEYDRVSLVSLSPVNKPLKLITKAEFERTQTQPKTAVK